MKGGTGEEGGEEGRGSTVGGWVWKGEEQRSGTEEGQEGTGGKGGKQGEGARIGEMEGAEFWDKKEREDSCGKEEAARTSCIAALPATHLHTCQVV